MKSYLFGRTAGAIRVGTNVTLQVNANTTVNIASIPGKTGVTIGSGVDPLYDSVTGNAVAVLDYGAINWAGRTTLDANTGIKIYYGDTDLNGVVDGSDYSRIDNAFANNQNGFKPAITGWFNGDFNYDGVISGSDYTLIDNAFNAQGASLAEAVASARD